MSSKDFDLKHETLEQTVRAAPAVGGTALSIMTLNEWVALATLIYILVQTIILVHKYILYLQDRKKRAAESEPKDCSPSTEPK